MDFIKHTYKADDCIMLLKDITESVIEVTVEEKEALINKGVNYSEMLSKEMPVDEEIKKIFLNLTDLSSKEIAKYVGVVSQQIFKNKGKETVLISLPRAGTPYGILIKRYIKAKYNIDVPHYGVSIIRGKGIDFNAMKYIMDKHPNCNIQFVDGWTGKGSITKELNKSIKEFNEKFGTKIDSSLAVIADPAKKSLICGTKKDINLPNCCLNSTVSGLISRTVHNKDIIGPNDFHGAKILDYLACEDFSNYYIEQIEKEFTFEDKEIGSFVDEEYVKDVLENIREKYNAQDIHKIKLSIGEASRALLRRKTRLVLVKDICNKDIVHIIHMAKNKGVEIKEYKDSGYECIAIIE